MFKTWFGLTLDAVLLGFETQRVMGAMMQMTKIDIKALEDAAKG